MAGCDRPRDGQGEAGLRHKEALPQLSCSAQGPRGAGFEELEFSGLGSHSPEGQVLYHWPVGFPLVSE